MGRTIATLICAAALLALPTLALAATTTYEGGGITDRAAYIKLRVAKVDGKRFVKRVVTKRLRYVAGGECGRAGRTDRQAIRGRWQIADDNTFRAVGQTISDDPLASGQLTVRGQVWRKRAKGVMRFTFGKTGCDTVRTEWRARRGGL